MPLDQDGDGILSSQEEELGTDPYNADSDGDGFTDDEELEEGTDPTDASDFPVEEEPDVLSPWETSPCEPEPESPGTNQTGQIAENVNGLNQFGEHTYLYDYCTKPTIMLIGGFG